MYQGLFVLQMISLLYLKLIVECKMYQHLVHLILFHLNVYLIIILSRTTCQREILSEYK